MRRERPAGRLSAMESRRLSRSSTSWRPAGGQEQAVGAAVAGIVPALQKSVLDQAIEQPHQRDRLQFQHFRQIDLRQALLLRATGTAQSIARAWCRGPWRDDRYSCAAAANSRQVARPIGVSDRVTCGRRSPKLSKCLGFSRYSVFTHKVHAYYMLGCWEPF